MHAVHVLPSKGTSLGRIGGGCDVVFDDARISRRHARIERSVAGWQLQDLGSRNRGFVNGYAYGVGERVHLVDGAVLRLGDTLLVFRASPPRSDGREASAVFPGVSPVAVDVRNRIDALALGSGHVLILGETGTGKERVAKAIGEHRATKPFVTLNSAELNRDLARSELFGHRKAAFTDARDNKLGLVDIAADGVLFLDEIGELDERVQSTLLRFLEDGSYRQMGSTDLRHSRARLVAATNVNLEQAVEQGRFRRDLLARLKINPPLQLPALRDRREDIPAWTELFFRATGRDVGPAPWTAGALECLLLYPWYENLRGVAGVVNDVLARTVTFPCKAESLPTPLLDHRAGLRTRAGQPGGDGGDGGDGGAPRRSGPDPSKAELDDALRQNHGNVRKTAEMLGLDRRKVYRLCERYGIAFDKYRLETEPEDE
jgi:DNA-binding NtrC family response regulator